MTEKALKLKESQRIIDFFRQKPEMYSDELIEIISNGIVHYWKEFQTVQQEMGDINLVREAHQAMDDMIAEIPEKTSSQFRCTAGCSHCCHQRVTTSEVEAKLIAMYCVNNNIPIDRKTLEAHADKDVPTRMAMPDSACVFLGDDHKCKIYKVRPMACRQYFVFTEPDLCDVKKNGDGKVGVYFGIDLELIASGFMNIDDGGELESLILKHLLKYAKFYPTRPKWLDQFNEPSGEARQG